MALNEGMDTDKVRDVASQLTTQSGKIGEVVQNGTSQAGTLAENWLGTDSEQFADAWQNAAKALQSAQDSLDAYAKAAVQQADDQDRGSGKGA
ncbi:WXG100 family type VII secretion target [Janibacter anophelis]|uniref:WXG100 family type VII secretion target n=1 Tax=Janibacter anophelis TaxID=319054 RepID=UPI000AF0FA77|nr:WXG100 family type VII secretion target [Janibacter anophelis]